MCLSRFNEQHLGHTRYLPSLTLYLVSFDDVWCLCKGSRFCLQKIKHFLSLISESSWELLTFVLLVLVSTFWFYLNWSLYLADLAWKHYSIASSNTFLTLVPKRADVSKYVMPFLRAQFFAYTATSICVCLSLSSNIIESSNLSFIIWVSLNESSSKPVVRDLSKSSSLSFRPTVLVVIF